MTNGLFKGSKLFSGEKGKTEPIAVANRIIPNEPQACYYVPKTDR